MATKTKTTEIEPEVDYDSDESYEQEYDDSEPQEASDSPQEAGKGRRRYQGPIVLKGLSEDQPVSRSTISLAMYEQILRPIVDQYAAVGKPVTVGLNIAEGSGNYVSNKFRATAFEENKLPGRPRFSLRAAVLDPGHPELDKRGIQLPEGESRLILTVGHPRMSKAEREAQKAAKEAASSVPGE